MTWETLFGGFQKADMGANLLQPLDNALMFDHKEVSKILDAHGGFAKVLTLILPSCNLFGFIGCVFLR